MSQKKKNASCIEVEMLSALIDGELTDELRSMVANHVDRCAKCREALRDVEQIRSGLTELAAINQPADLWPQIERQRKLEMGVPIIERLRRWWFVPIAAASCAAAIALLLWIGSAADDQDQAEEQDAIEAIQSVNKARLAYREAIVALERALAGRIDDFEPAVRETIEQSLADIDQAIERCQNAVGENPDNPEAHLAVLAAYQRKVDLLSELVLGAL